STGRFRRMHGQSPRILKRHRKRCLGSVTGPAHPVTQSATPTRGLPRPAADRLHAVAQARPLRAGLSARAYAAGVALCTAGVAAFVLVQLHAWPPHEDETLALFTSALSYLAVERALERGGRRWAWWGLAVLATVATHPYGALVLASQGLYVLLRRVRVRQAVVAFGAVLVAGIPFWWTDVVLAG